MCEYENMRRIRYESGAIFVPVCITCGRFVKADKVIDIIVDGPIVDQPNADCSKCGRTKMVHEGFI